MRAEDGEARHHQALQEEGPGVAGVAGVGEVAEIVGAAGDVGEDEVREHPWQRGQWPWEASLGISRAGAAYAEVYPAGSWGPLSEIGLSYCYRDSDRSPIKYSS